MKLKKSRFAKRFMTTMLALCAGLILAGVLATNNSCSGFYEPYLQPMADVLHPGPEVDILGFTPEGDVIVTKAYIPWTEALKAEIKRLRTIIKEGQEPSE